MTTLLYQGKRNITVIDYTLSPAILEDDDRGFEKSMEESGEGQKAPSQLVIPKPKKQKKL